MISRLCAFALFVVGAGLGQPGRADIYIYTAEDGSVSLSNVPADSRYSVLIASHKEAEAALPVVAKRKGPKDTSRKARYGPLVEKVATAYGVDSALIRAVIAVESGYDPKAFSKRGAAGLMQLMPGTALRYGVTDAFDPEQNLDGGAHYLRDLLEMFNHNVSLALAAYNAGENAVARYSNQIPPFRETARYVPRALNFYQRYQAGL